MTFKQNTRDTLRNVSTATLATCLFKRGLRNQMIQDVRPLRSMTTSMVGEAYTLHYMLAQEYFTVSRRSVTVPIRSARPWKNACPARSW